MPAKMFESFDYSNHLRATVCHSLGHFGLSVTRDIKVNRALPYDRLCSIHRFHRTDLDSPGLSRTDPHIRFTTALVELLVRNLRFL